MDDEAVAQLAEIVSNRVFESMSKFVDVLEDLVRENEALRAKVDRMELLLLGPDDEDDEDDYDDEDDRAPGPDDEVDDFFDHEHDWEPEDDDGDLFGSN